MKVNAEIEAAIKKAIPDAAQQTALIAELTATKTVARTPEEEDQYKTNLLSASKEDLLKEEKKVWMRRIEDDIKELTGLRQKPSEPYHEYMKRGITDLKSKLEEMEEQKAEWEKNGGSADTVWKQKYDTLEKQSKQAIADKEKELDSMKKTNATTERRIELDKVLNPMKQKFMDNLPAYFNDYQESVIKEILGTSAIIDGKLVLVDSAGNPMKDGQLNNILVEDHLKMKFKDVIVENKQQGGAGSKGGGNPPPGGNGGGKGPVNVKNIPDEVNTESKLTEYLGKQGLLQGSKEFDETFDTAVKEKNITKIF